MCTDLLVWNRSCWWCLVECHRDPDILRLRSPPLLGCPVRTPAEGGGREKQWGREREEQDRQQDVWFFYTWGTWLLSSDFFGDVFCSSGERERNFSCKFLTDCQFLHILELDKAQWYLGIFQNILLRQPKTNSTHIRAIIGMRLIILT